MSAGQEAVTDGIAVIGIACRFPGAGDVGQYWENLLTGRDCITRYSPAELVAAGVPEQLAAGPRYVCARGVVEGIEEFDAEFFAMSPREAAATDPQHRVFLEVAWEAMEAAGHVPGTPNEIVGVYAGCGQPTYLAHNVDEVIRQEGEQRITRIEAGLGNDKDYLANRVAYKLGLTGPAVSVQTACSSSLVAVAVAAQALDCYDCDVALAGGSNLHIPQVRGYAWEPDGIMSANGSCRPFDRRADGTVPGDGVGVVVLRRLADAIKDGDEIQAVIRGWAVNNDGAGKVGFTAPSITGQRTAVLTAQARAGLSGDDIGYLETHGTGTALGDVIEISALTEAFRATSARAGRCALGGVKANIGHAVAAAGIAGLIKAVLAVRHGTIPPQPNFEVAAAELALADSPFHVTTAPIAWPSPRNAGVSSFGIGGTNAHLIVGEPPPTSRWAGPATSAELLVVSARTPAALSAARDRLGAALAAGDRELNDVAFTMAVGRTQHAYRWSAACADLAEARARLAEPATATRAATDPPVAFLFPGGGAQYVGMAGELYAAEPVFRNALKQCVEAVRALLGLDLTGILAPDKRHAAPLLDGTAGLPALFATEYALARLLMSWGVRPTVVGGHSLGEYTAATIAGVLTIEDAVELVGARGRLLDAAADGAMLAVRATPGELTELITDDVDIAAYNGPRSCALSGPLPAIKEIERRLTETGLRHRRVPLAVAAHSRLIEPVLPEFAAAAGRVPLRPPTMLMLSCRTGSWLTAYEATSPDYWVRHLRDPVRFTDLLATLAGLEGAVLVEVGPGHALTESARGHGEHGLTAFSTIPALTDPRSARQGVLEAVGGLWRHGVHVDLTAPQADRPRHRVTLPAYPWQRTRHWLCPADGERPRAPSPPAREGSAAPAGPATTEQVSAVVAAEWREALGLSADEDTGENFFKLGGQSLIGVRLMNRLSEIFGVPLKLRMLFDNPTVAGLAALIVALRASAPPGPGQRG